MRTRGRLPTVRSCAESVDGDEREKGEEEEFWFLFLIPIRRAIPVAAATMVMVTATACCLSSLEKNTAGCLLASG